MKLTELIRLNEVDLPEIDKYVSKFDSFEELMRSGGIPTDLLDKVAFGFNEKMINKLWPKQLHIKWKEDIKNPIRKAEEYGNKKEWAKTVNLSEPIEVSYEKKKFFIEDGHHRYYAAKILGVPLNVNLTIKDNPLTEMGTDYDTFHREVFKRVKGHK